MAGWQVGRLAGRYACYVLGCPTNKWLVRSLNQIRQGKGNPVFGRSVHIVGRFFQIEMHDEMQKKDRAR